MCRINNFYICYIFFILQLTKVIKNTDYKKINNNNIHFIIEIELLTKTLPNVRYKHKYISHVFIFSVGESQLCSNPINISMLNVTIF
jgi:hypothetical protein